MATRTTNKTTTDPNANKVSVNTNKVKVNANKVAINAAKVRANAAKVAANTAKVKANANAKPVPSLVSSFKTTVVTPKAKAVAPAPVKAKMNTIPVRNTTAKDYEIYDKANLNRSGSLYHGTGLYGTKAQQDSSIASISKYNVKAPGIWTITKSSNFPGNEATAAYAKASRIDYVPPKDTKSGPLRKKPQTKATMEELAKRWQ